MKIAVVIPSYRVRKKVLSVLARIGPEVDLIYVVDDCCPERSGEHVESGSRDPRVRVIRHQENLGVGGATITGYRAALRDGADVVVKLDGDGQMDPEMIPRLIQPIVSGLADYSKGNRFFRHESLAAMPWVRLIGNSALSFINKVVSGYWNLMDPTNGFVAIHQAVLRMLPLDKISRRYFFESDMLFRLNTLRAVVQEVPMDAVYQDEESNLKIGQVMVEFPKKYLARYVKRIGYNYFLRDFNVCTIQLVLGSVLFGFGVIFGSLRWYESGVNGVPASTGTVMLAALPVIMGFQLLLAAISYDVHNIPRLPLQLLFGAEPRVGEASLREQLESKVVGLPL